MPPREWPLVWRKLICNPVCEVLFAGRESFRAAGWFEFADPGLDTGRALLFCQIRDVVGMGVRQKD